jgi:hypothetical protein
MHEIAYGIAQENLAAARRRRAGSNLAQSRRQLQEELRGKLGDIEPAPGAHAETYWVRSLPGGSVEAIGLSVEEGIGVPMLLIRPADTARAPVVVGLAKDGKDRFVQNRSEAIERLIQAGVAVCLPDLRGTGETSPDPDAENDGHGMIETEVALGNTLTGARLKDLRTVLAYLRNRKEVDGRRVALWGESFSPANPQDMFLDELESEAAPRIQHRAEPFGSTLALLAALYEADVRVIAAGGGLAGYTAVLENAYAYVSMDAIVPGLLRSADIADIAAAHAPHPLLLGALVDGRNVRLSPAKLSELLAPTRQAYAASGAANRLVLESEPQDAGVWLASQLKENR